MRGTKRVLIYLQYEIFNAFIFLIITHLLGPKLIFVTGLVIFVTPVARLVYPDLLG